MPNIFLISKLDYWFWITLTFLFHFFSSRYNVQAVFKVSESNGWDVKHLASSEVRIIILYCTRDEASDILGEKIISTRKGIKGPRRLLYYSALSWLLRISSSKKVSVDTLFRSMKCLKLSVLFSFQLIKRFLNAFLCYCEFWKIKKVGKSVKMKSFKLNFAKIKRIVVLTLWKESPISFEIT